MSRYAKEIAQGQAINTWHYSGIKLDPVKSEKETIDAAVNNTEGYLEIEYPVRRTFISELEEITIDNKNVYNKLYTGLESPRIDFSTFIATPHKISTYLKANFVVPNDGQYDFSLITCGRAIVWVNNELVSDFKPYTRNKGSETLIQMPLQGGDNEVILYMDDLAERDVNYFVELRKLSDQELIVDLPLTYDSKILEDRIDFLEGLYIEKDFYDEGDVIVHSDHDSVDEVFISYEEVFLSNKMEGDGDLTDFKRSNQFIKVENRQIKIGNVTELKTSGLTELFVVVDLPDKSQIYKKLVFSLYDKENMYAYNKSTLEERKLEALENFANIELPDMNSALAAFYLGQPYDERIQNKLLKAYSLLEMHGDCADFALAPLLSYSLLEDNKLPDEVKDKIKTLALAFRYWIDEPGNDVMWYFSENHSLLFHICQYFAGHLFADKIFEVSGRTGNEQYQLGKERLLDWFRQFESYGFSEWNSATYLPIDLIGFFSLYNSAPDEELRLLAKRALDYTFKFIAINQHGGTLASTFGRTYEHDLKAMRLGEISNILEIAWKKGYPNYALRAATLFCLSDYEPPVEYLDYIELDDNQSLTANYLQGVNQVETYLYKTKHYSLASAVRYKARQKGHQQHMMNISLGDDITLLWINNPGEYAHSGENRPSFWAGNGIFPSIHQYKNVLMMDYDLSDAVVKKVHMYLPFWQLTEIDSSDKHWLFIKKEDAYLAVHFSQAYEIEEMGATRNREVMAFGENHSLIVKCSSKIEAGSFESFKQRILQSEIKENSFNDYQFGEFNWTDDNLILNGDTLGFAATYDVEPVIEIVEEEEN